MRRGFGSAAAHARKEHEFATATGRTSCFLCGWSSEGSFAEGKQRFTRHRDAAHGQRMPEDAKDARSRRYENWHRHHAVR